MTESSDRVREQTIEIHTDGACSGNPGPGGWAALLKFGDVEKSIVGGTSATTNNRMELTAALEALKALKRPCTVRLFSDSAYLVSAFQQKWLDKWKGNGWRNSGGDPVSNIDLWMELDRLASGHRVEWIKVKGHADNEGNNRCDKLAVEEMKRCKSAETGREGIAGNDGTA
jgi:ribonuclease HI